MKRLSTEPHRYKPPRVVVVGSVNCDLTAFVDAFPATGETVLADRSLLALGGKGLNQAVAAARAAADVTLIACIGNDPFADIATRYLDRNAIDVRHVCRMADAATGTANIIVSSAGQNMIAVAPGANASLTPDHVAAAEPAVAAADVVVAQLEVPLETVRAALRMARAHGVQTILDPAPGDVRAIGLFPLADVLTPNESETQLLTGIAPSSPAATRQAIEILQNQGARTVIVTQADAGCTIAVGDHHHHIPAFAIDAVDPTGAGDVFNGVLAVGLARGLAPDEAARNASAAAALSVTRWGAQDAAPTLPEIAAFLEPSSSSAQAGAAVQ